MSRTDLDSERARSRSRCLTAIDTHVYGAVVAFEPKPRLRAGDRFYRLLFQSIGDVVAAENGMQDFRRIPVTGQSRACGVPGKDKGRHCRDKGTQASHLVVSSRILRTADLSDRSLLRRTDARLQHLPSRRRVRDRHECGANLDLGRIADDRRTANVSRVGGGSSRNWVVVFRALDTSACGVMLMNGRLSDDADASPRVRLPKLLSSKYFF